MAARTSTPNKRQQDQTREAIRTTQLVKRLQHFALGENDEQGAMVDLDANKLRAIEVLLRKSLPDLSTVTLQGDEDGGPIGVVFKTIYEKNGD
jgi:hypothetical protein